MVGNTLNLSAHTQRFTEQLVPQEAQWFAELSYDAVPTVFDGDYSQVSISQREPLLTADEVRQQVFGEWDIEGPDLGDLMAEMVLPSPQFTGMDKASRRFNKQMSTFYVFRRSSRNGPVYTLMGQDSLQLLREGQGSNDPRIVELGRGRPSEIVVGRSGWLPSVGRDTNGIPLQSEVGRLLSTVSGRQGSFSFDVHSGDLTYTANASINQAYGYMRKTALETQWDGYNHSRRQQAQAQLLSDRPTKMLRLYGRHPHKPMVEDDLLTTVPRQRTGGGH